MKKLCFLSHSQDPDGIISQALLIKHVYQEYGTTVSFDQYLLDYPELYYFFHETNLDKYTQIFISDFGLNESVIEDERIVHLAKQKKIYYFDHHELSEQRKLFFRKQFVMFYSNDELCASEILANVFFEQNDYVEFLKCVARSYDFDIKGDAYKISERLRRIIAVSDDFTRKELVKDIACGRCFDKHEFSQAYIELEEKAKKIENLAYQQINETIEKISVNDIKIVIAYAPKILYMKPAMRYLEIECSDCNIAILLTQDVSNILIGSIKRILEIDDLVLNYCMSKGGGGRGAAGGYNFGKNITIEKYNTYKDIIFEDFKNYVFQELS